MKSSVILLLLGLALSSKGDHEDGAFSTPGVPTAEPEPFPVTDINLPSSEPISCGGMYVVNSTYSKLTSPGYPEKSGNNLRCNYTFTKQKYDEFFELEIVVDTESCCDYVEVFVLGESLGRIRGYQPRVIVTSFASPVTLLYHTDSSVLSNGFVVAYQEVFLTCGLLKLQATSNWNNLTAYNFPVSPLANDSECFWTIENELPISFEIQKLHLDDEKEFVEIHDGLKNLGRFTGNVTGPIKFLGRAFRIRFSSHKASNSTEFEARFKLADPPSQCPEQSSFFCSDETTCSFCTTCPEGTVCCPNCCGTACSYTVNLTTTSPPVTSTPRPTNSSCGGFFRSTGTFQNFTSPGFPSKSSNYLNCNYTFLPSEPNTLIEIEIQVQTETCCDYVEVLEGGINLGRIRGYQPRALITGSPLTLRYFTDSSVLSDGFQGRYRQFVRTCGFHLTPTNYWQNFSTPRFPSPYPNVSECFWTTQDERPIQLQIHSFDLEYKSDFLEIHDGTKNLGRFTGTIATPLKFIGKQFRIRFSSDANLVWNAGLFASYKYAESSAECPPANLNCGDSNRTCEVCTTCSVGEVCCPDCCGTVCKVPTNSSFPYTTAIPSPSPTPTSGPCPPYAPYTYCYVPPCQNASCPGEPNSFCFNYQCGGCFANFTDYFGNSISEERCRENTTTPELTCPVSSTQCDAQTIWLCNYIKWRVDFLRDWQRTFEDWRTNYPLPGHTYTPRTSCLYLHVTCRNPGQWRVLRDYYDCEIQYCADGYYRTGPGLQVWLTDQNLWQRFYSLWKESLEASNNINDYSPTGSSCNP